jgi:glycosyltransferase involved in cell wall biosynthesis
MNDEEMIISFVIPDCGRALKLYNCIQSIERVLESSKFNRNYEIIVIDDNSGQYNDISNDFKRAGTTHKLNYYKSPADKNMGPGYCRNIGTGFTRGKYLFYIDSDDLLLPGFEDLLIQHIENNNICTKGIIKTTFDYQHEPKILTPTGDKKLDLKDYAFAKGSVITRDYLVSNGIAFPITRYAEDLAFMFKLLMMRTCKYEICSEIAYQSIVWENNTMMNSWGDKVGTTFTELAKGMTSVLEFYELNKDSVIYNLDEIEEIYGRNFSYVRKHI